MVHLLVVLLLLLLLLQLLAEVLLFYFVDFSLNLEGTIFIIIIIIIIAWRLFLSHLIFIAGGLASSWWVVFFVIRHLRILIIVVIWRILEAGWVAVGRGFIRVVVHNEPSEMGVEAIFNHIFRPALQKLGNLAPVRTKEVVFFENEFVLLLRPRVLVDRRV